MVSRSYADNEMINELANDFRESFCEADHNVKWPSLTYGEIPKMTEGKIVAARKGFKESIEEAIDNANR